MGKPKDSCECGVPKDKRSRHCTKCASLHKRGKPNQSTLDRWDSDDIKIAIEASETWSEAALRLTPPADIKTLQRLVDHYGYNHSHFRFEKYRHLSGRYGSWTVLYYLGPNASKNGMTEWLCRCDCGREKPVVAQYLVNGTSSRCQNCSRHARPYPRLLPDPFWRLITQGANRRSIACELTQEEAESLFRDQGGRCALTGLEIRLPTSGTDYLRGNHTASLDRIDSRGPYRLDNVQWVHKDLNRMKNIFDAPYFVAMCRLVVDHHGESDR